MARNLQERALRIAICHPDLGIGGAERLVVDAAMELKAAGHHVHVFTAHHDHNHCFEETLGGNFPVDVYGDFLPRNVFNRLHALCAYIRCLYVAVCMVLLWPAYDVVFVDQVSAVIPVLKLKRTSKILFYCHFPDLLLAQHATLMRKMYRAPLDKLEEITTGKADVILVNSEFTASIFGETFKNLHEKGICPSVLYPAIDVQQFSYVTTEGSLQDDHSQADLEHASQGPYFLSINRFERKKNIGLAISALAHAVRQQEIVERNNKDCGKVCSDLQHVQLIIVGGYDARLSENREYLSELKMLALEEGVSERVKFEPSCSTSRKNALLKSCICVIYTPEEEHFGIVPLEAMASRKPVIACNSGGPMESIQHTITGFLCEPSKGSFAAAMLLLIREPAKADVIGNAARKHVEQNFSRQVFGARLNTVISSLTASNPPKALS